MALIIPKRYQQRLLPETTEVAIKTIKDSFQKKNCQPHCIYAVSQPHFSCLQALASTTTLTERSTLWHSPSMRWAASAPRWYTR